MSTTRKAKSPLFRIRGSAIQGRGAFAVRRIRKGQRITEYTGERISPDEVERRYDDDSMDRHHTFLFEVDENTVIDGTRRVGRARYINHCCQPNCEAVNDDGRIFIEAIKNIQPGVELTYDYAYEHEGRLTRALIAQYPCFCGTKRCRGTILKPRRRRKTRGKAA